MSISVTDVLETARQLAPEDRLSLIAGLLEEDEAIWRVQVGEPEAGHCEWMAKRIQDSLTDTRPAVTTEEAMSRARAAIFRASEMKQSA